MLPPRNLSSALLLGALSFLILFRANAETPSGPPELVEFIEKAGTAREEAIDTPIAEKLSALDENYASALKRAGETAQRKGDLEAAILIKSELDRMEAGEPFDLEKEIPLTSATRIVYTYSDELEKIAAEQKTFQQAFAAKVDAGLNQLIADLTKGDRLEDALKVKEYSESDAVSQIVEGGEDSVFLIGVSDTDTPASISASTEATMKASTKTILPGDLPPGRLVFIALTPGAKLPPGFQAAADADMTDIAMVGRTTYGNVGVIRSDGALVYWNGSGEPEIIPGNNIFCEQSFGLPLIGLDQTGKLNATSDADSETKAAIEAQSDVVHIGVTSGICAVISSDGKLDVIGPRDDIENAKKMEEIQNAAGTGFSGAAFASVLKTDGTVADFVNGEEQNGKPKDTVTKLHGFRIGENERGEVIQWGGGGRTMLEEIGENPRKVFAMPNLFVAISREGEFFLYRKEGNSSIERVDGDNDALEGANSFTWVGGQGEEWLIVVLPADSVPRSGLWTLEELAADRSSR